MKNPSPPRRLIVGLIMSVILVGVLELVHTLGNKTSGGHLVRSILVGLIIGLLTMLFLFLIGKWKRESK